MKKIGKDRSSGLRAPSFFGRSRNRRTGPGTADGARLILCVLDVPHFRGWIWLWGLLFEHPPKPQTETLLSNCSSLKAGEPQAAPAR